MTARRHTDFDRLRPRQGHAEPEAQADAVPDQQGKRALFSSADDAERPASFGAVTVLCGSCGERSVLTPKQALQHAVPSVHLPIIKRTNSSWMRCPACKKRTWVSVVIQL